MRAATTVGTVALSAAAVASAGALLVTGGTAAALAGPQPESSSCVVPQVPPGLFVLRDLACGVGAQGDPSTTSANPGRSTSY